MIFSIWHVCLGKPHGSILIFVKRQRQINLGRISSETSQTQKCLKLFVLFESSSNSLDQSLQASNLNQASNFEEAFEDPPRGAWTTTRSPWTSHFEFQRQRRKGWWNPSKDSKLLAKIRSLKSGLTSRSLRPTSRSLQPPRVPTSSFWNQKTRSPNPATSRSGNSHFEDSHRGPWNHHFKTTTNRSNPATIRSLQWQLRGNFSHLEVHTSHLEVLEITISKSLNQQ